VYLSASPNYSIILVPMPCVLCLQGSCALDTGSVSAGSASAPRTLTDSILEGTLACHKKYVWKVETLEKEFTSIIVNE
jgi:hypothetical protein